MALPTVLIRLWRPPDPVRPRRLPIALPTSWPALERGIRPVFHARCEAPQLTRNTAYAQQCSPHYKLLMQRGEASCVYRS